MTEGTVRSRAWPRSFPPERKARVAAKVHALSKAEMPLAEQRQARERSQEELARELKVGQPRGRQA